MRPDLAVTAEDMLATAHSIARQQEASGAIPWFAPVGDVPGHVDVWNHNFPLAKSIVEHHGFGDVEK